MSDNDQTWQDRGDKAYTKFTNNPWRTGFKWLLIFLAVVIAISVLFAVIGWIGSWGDEAKRVTSPQNVREQNTRIIDDWEGMQAAGMNVCNVQSSAAKGETDPTLIEDPALAYKAQYRRIRVDYNRRMANLYEAQAVRSIPLPSNLRSYPEVAPTVEEFTSTAC